MPEPGGIRQGPFQRPTRSTGKPARMSALGEVTRTPGALRLPLAILALGDILIIALKFQVIFTILQI